MNSGATGAMINELPRVTYTNTSADYSPLHELLDRELPKFRSGLGREISNFIGGRDDREGAPYEAVSPLDSRLRLGTFIEPTQAAISRAVAAARKASDVWSYLPWTERVAAMRRFADVIDRRKYELAMAVIYEVGKNRMEALGETEEAVALVRHYCDQLEQNQGFIEKGVAAGAGETARTSLKPYGVFAVISPFNYPVGLVANMVGAALVAGNTVVLKASPQSAVSASMFVKAANEAGLPDGVLNLLCGSQSGPRLVDESGIDGFAFTGSYKAGTEILRKVAAGPFMRPVLAEMGGKNVAYVSKSADLPVAVEGVARSAFNMGGQKCSACSIALVHSSLYPKFIEALIERSAAFRFGNTEKREITNGPLINAAALARYEAAVEHGKKEGRVVFGGKRLTGGEFDFANFVTPAIVTDLPESDRLFCDELFAPVLAVAKFDDLADALRRGNRTPYGLTSGFYGADEKDIDYYVSHVEAGVLYVNRRTGATTGAWPGIQSFCGWKGSGLTGKGGLGTHYLPQFLREQSLTIRQ